MKRGTPNHRKMHRLARCLRVSLPEAVGTMELLWHWVADYLPRGDIGKSENWEIAAAVHWSKDPDELVNALIDEHWLDRSETCRLLVHDWAEHCEESVHTRLARSREYFADGSRPRLGKLGGADRESAELFYSGKSSKQDRPKQQTLPLSDSPKSDLTQTSEEGFTRGHGGAIEGPQKDLAKPSQAIAKPSLLASERKGPEEEPLAARLDQIGDRLHRFMGVSRKPDAAIIQTIAGILEGFPIETLDAFLLNLNGRKIKSYGFFPSVLRKELPNLTAAQTPEPKPTPPEEDLDEIAEYYTWRLSWIKAEYIRTHGQAMFRKQLKSQEKTLIKEYPSMAVMKANERETLAERRFLNELSSLPEMQIPKFGDYRRMARPERISAVGVAEISSESKEQAKLSTAGGSV